LSKNVNCLLLKKAGKITPEREPVFCNNGFCYSCNQPIPFIANADWWRDNIVKIFRGLKDLSIHEVERPPHRNNINLSRELLELYALQIIKQTHQCFRDDKHDTGVLISSPIPIVNKNLAAR
jgi:hypothetical protein